MSRRHDKTLEAVYKVPTVASLKFSDIEKLLLLLGAEVIEGRGSRVSFLFPDNPKWEAHHLHPGKEAKKYQVESLRRFLESRGIGNE
ncbi:MAG TPA: type II toxin-antitoxin system HicA family toxin [Pyrinomonadaceae bacterium]|nr:type II toxin-antitoxin system HicA family toxin [Pyrinomonadaceae bacterium]